MSKISPPTVRRQSAKAPAIQTACWLSPEVLLTLQAGKPDDGMILLRQDKSGGRFSKHKPRLTMALAPASNRSLTLSLFSLPDNRQTVNIQLQSPSQPSKATLPADLKEMLVDLQTFLRQHLAPLPAEVRQDVLQALLAAVAGHKAGDCAKLAQSLVLIREALRQRLPAVQISPEAHCGAHVDQLFALDERAFYIRGWASVKSGRWTRLTAVSPEGTCVELMNRIFWHRRPDIEKLYSLPPDQAAANKSGFCCYFELPFASTQSAGWLLEAVDDAGEAFEVRAPSVCTDCSAARRTLIADLDLERLPQQQFRLQHVLPAITRLQQAHQSQILIDQVFQFGSPPSAPEASVVIPLYRRVDFLEHQLAQFVHDPAIGRADLIYVLDSPELAEGLQQLATALFELYRVPFRLAVLNQNAGYAIANNLGASLARGRRLLLLNSDVLPDQPGWLERLVSFYNAKPDAGAVGAKLLFEDDTLQHAGLYFRRSVGSGLWENQHYFKGLDRHLPAANVTRTVPAVSAACMMISRELLQQLGGLRGIYVQGDYEDSDLCLRLRAAGREIWYLPEVELYHLEGQSYASADRARNLALNRWLHTHFWDRQIETLMNQTNFTCHSHG